MAKRRQGIFWVLTIPANDYVPSDRPEIVWSRGQREIGEGGYEHWQILVAFRTKTSLAGCKAIFGRTCHAELSRSEAAAAYVWKEETRVEGTQFEYGAKPIQRYLLLL